jgi:MATE family multidrug resistance protein
MTVNSDISTASRRRDMPHSFLGEMKALLVLAVPMSVTQVIQFAVYVADTMMLGRVSTEAVAAAALGSFFVFFAWMIAAGPVNAVTPMVSQALGRDSQAFTDVRRSVRMSLWAIGLICIPLVAVLAFTEPLLLFFGQDPEVSSMAAQYAWMIAPGLPFALAIQALRNFLAALDETIWPMILVSLTVLLNIGLNALLIFGLWGFPELGLIGAGIASSISYAVSFGLFVLLIRWHERAKQFQVFRNVFSFDRERFGEVVRLAWPISITTMFEGMLFNVALFVMGIIGVAEQAAYQVGLNVAAMAFMVPWGFAMGGAVRIGLAEGAGNAPARMRAAGTTLLVSTVLMAGIALFTALQGEFIASLYFGFEPEPDDAVVRSLVLLFLPVAAAFMIVDAAQVTCNQLLRGLKDVTVPIYITGFSYWVVGFPLCWSLAFYTPLGAVGVWWGLAAGLFVAFIGLGIRLWQQLQRPPSPPEVMAPEGMAHEEVAAT